MKTKDGFGVSIVISEKKMDSDESNKSFSEIVRRIVNNTIFKMAQEQGFLFDSMEEAERFDEEVARFAKYLYARNKAEKLRDEEFERFQNENLG